MRRSPRQKNDYLALLILFLAVYLVIHGLGSLLKLAFPGHPFFINFMTYLTALGWAVWYGNEVDINPWGVLFFAFIAYFFAFFAHLLSSYALIAQIFAFLTHFLRSYSLPLLLSVWGLMKYLDPNALPPIFSRHI